LPIRTRENTNGRIPSDSQPNHLELHALRVLYTETNSWQATDKRNLCRAGCYVNASWDKTR